MKNSSFVKSSITLMSGSMLAQLVTIISAIVFARIYSPEELGIYTLVLTAESLFGGIMCLRYEVSIVTEKCDDDVFAIIKLSLLIVFFLSAVFSVSYGWIYFINNNEIRSCSYLLVLFLFLMLLTHGLICVLDSYNNRQQKYKLMTSAYLFRTCIQNIGAIVLGLLGCGVTGLVGAHTFGSIGGVKKQSRNLTMNKHSILSVTKDEMFKVAKKYRNLPFYSAPAVFANRYSYSSISLFLNQLFDATTLGFYSITYKALGLPLTVLSNNVSKVFFRDATKEYNQNGCFRRTFNKTCLILIVMVVPLFFLIFFGSPLLVKIILGSKWLVAVKYIRILLPMFLVRLFVNTIAYGLQIVNKQQYELFYQLLLVFSSVAAFFIAKYFDWTVESFLSLISLSFSVVYLLYFTSVMYFAYKND